MQAKYIAEVNEIPYPEHTVRLHNLNLDNFRGFTNLEIKFHDNLTILISNNGGGKTTILDGIAEILRNYLHTTFLQNPEKKFKTTLVKRDIKNGTNFCTNKLQLKVSYNKLEDAEVDGNSKEVWFQYKGDVSLECVFNEKAIFSLRDSDDENALDFVGYKKLLSKINKEQETLPVLLYYGCGSVENTLVGKSDKNSYISKHNRLNNIYYEALKPQRVSFHHFFTWFDNKSKIKLQLDADNKSWNLEAKKVVLMQKAIEFMYSDNTDSVFNNFRIDYIGGEAVMKIDKINKITQDKAELDIAQMSSGEKNFFALVVDIAMRLIEANPNAEMNLEELREIEKHANPETLEEADRAMEQWLFENRGLGVQKAKEEYAKYIKTERIKKEEQWLFDNLQSPLKTGQGIVLIDEIDLHLHPKWQRKVVPKLLKLFPNVQFVMTTHSPFVLQSGASVDFKKVILDKGEVVVSEDSNSLLSESYEAIGCQKKKS